MKSTRKRLVVGNWKMNLTVGEGYKLLAQLDKNISASPKTEVVICPSAMALGSYQRQVATLKFKLGAQNIHWQDQGAFTGEISAAQIAKFVDYAIVGHSERRIHFGETNDIVARKVSAAVRNGLIPIICVGENLIERQDDHTARVVHDQLAAALVMLTTREIANVVVAYEPVWAIGTGEIAKPEQLKDAVRVIRKTISELYGTGASAQVRVLYGGSVEADFVADYLKLGGLDGFLVGGASLSAPSFTAIIKAVQSGKLAKAHS